MINDYYAIRVERMIDKMPDDMVHDLAHKIELKALEAGIKANDIAVLFESIYRQLPKVHGVELSDAVNTEDKIG